MAIELNGYQLHPILFAEMEKTAADALKEMRADFTPETGCGQDIKKLVDLFTKAAAVNEACSVHGWNECARLVKAEGHYPTTIYEMAHAVGQVITVYIYG